MEESVDIQVYDISSEWDRPMRNANEYQKISYLGPRLISLTAESFSPKSSTDWAWSSYACCLPEGEGCHCPVTLTADPVDNLDRCTVNQGSSDDRVKHVCKLVERTPWLGRV